MLENQIESIINNVKATMAVENHFAQDKEIEMAKRVLNKEISVNEAVRIIKNEYM